MKQRKAKSDKPFSREMWASSKKKRWSNFRSEKFIPPQSGKINQENRNLRGVQRKPEEGMFAYPMTDVDVHDCHYNYTVSLDAGQRWIVTKILSSLEEAREFYPHNRLPGVHEGPPQSFASFFERSKFQVFHADSSGAEQHWLGKTGARVFFFCYMAPILKDVPVFCADDVHWSEPRFYTKLIEDAGGLSPPQGWDRNRRKLNFLKKTVWEAVKTSAAVPIVVLMEHRESGQFRTKRRGFLEGLASEGKIRLLDQTEFLRLFARIEQTKETSD